MEKWDLYKLALEQFREHPRIFWVRNSFFVTIQSGLLAFAAFNLRDLARVQSIDLVLGCVGLVIALVWLYVVVASRRLLRAWREIVLQVEREAFGGGAEKGALFHMEHGLFERAGRRGEGTRVGYSITAAMLALAVCFVLAWSWLVGSLTLQLAR